MKHERRAMRRSAVATLALLAVVGVPNLAPAAASPPNPSHVGRADTMVRFLQEVQNADGGFGGERGEASSPIFSAWVALALVCGGINPKDQARAGGTDAYTYLATHTGELELTTDFERVLLVVNASEASPDDFGGLNLVDEILSRQLPDGSFAHEAGGKTAGVNDTIFAILSLSPVREARVDEAVQKAASWVEDEQYPEGSWPPVKPKGEPGEVDMTGAAIEALNAAGRADTDAQAKAIEYLHRAQGPNGGFPEKAGQIEANVASTAWAVQGIWAAGQNPETWVRRAGAEPFSYMESLQREDGHVRFEEKKEENGVWMTAYVAPAFFGQKLPPVPVPDGAPPTPTPPQGGSPTPSPGSLESGQGGVSSQQGRGVIAGGGGTSSPLFAAPRPQSKGAAPGGVRQLRKPLKQHTPTTREPKLHRSAATVQSNLEPNSSHGVGSGSAAKGVGATATGTGSSPSTGDTQHGTGSGAGLSANGAGGSASERVLKVSGSGALGVEQDVRGVVIGKQSSIHGQALLEPGAPGLHSAGAGGTENPWLAIGLGGSLAALMLTGSQFERRRTEVVL